MYNILRYEWHANAYDGSKVKSTALTAVALEGLN